MGTKGFGKGIMGRLFGTGGQQQLNGASSAQEALKKDLSAPISIMTKPFDPEGFLGKGWKTWKGPIKGSGLSGEEEIDPRSLNFFEIEIAKFIFETGLREGEESIPGEEKLRRLKDEKPGFIRFGGNVFLGLWQDYQASKENSVIEWLYRDQKIGFMDFFGQILRNPTGTNQALCMFRRGNGNWRWDCYWLQNAWIASRPSVGCASQPKDF